MPDRLTEGGLKGRMIVYVAFLATVMALCMCSTATHPLQFAEVGGDFTTNPSSLVPTQVGIQETRLLAPEAPGSRLTPG